MTRDRAVSVCWVQSADAIPEELWAQCFPPPLEGRWWYTALERAGLDDQFTFAYAMLMRGENAIGIAPAFVMDVPLDIVAPPSLARLLRSLVAWFPRLRY